MLFDFLFQSIELRSAVKLTKGNFKSVTKFFDGNAAGILAFTI